MVNRIKDSILKKKNRSSQGYNYLEAYQERGSCENKVSLMIFHLKYSTFMDIHSVPAGVKQFYPPSVFCLQWLCKSYTCLLVKCTGRESYTNCSMYKIILSEGLSPLVHAKPNMFGGLLYSRVEKSD